jgi:transcriptional regulator with XRE-family HTH domain
MIEINPRIPKRAEESFHRQRHYENEFLPKLGTTVAKYRKRAAYTQRELAEHLGVTVTHISALENGRRGVSLHVLYRIAGILTADLATMINEANGIKPPTTDR